MRVCHITTVHPRYDIRIFKKECTSLAKFGYEVILVVNDRNNDEILNNVYIHDLGITVKTRFDRVTKVVNKAYEEALKINAELYHLHDPELLKIVAKLRKKGKKVVFDSHEFTAMQILTKAWIPSSFRKLISRLYKKYEGRVLSKISGLIVPCTYEGEDYFKNINVPKEIIGNYPSKAVLNLYDSTVIRDSNLIGYAGSITKARGVIVMVKAAYLAKKTLVLIGDITDELLIELRNMPEYSCVDYKGVLPHEEVMKELGKCYIGLSILEGNGQYASIDNLPTKLYEYMALGIPSVVSNFRFYEDCLKKYKFGIAVNPENYYEVADAIEKISDNRKYAEEMCNNGRRAISEEMNWELEAEKLRKFYDKLI